MPIATPANADPTDELLTPNEAARWFRRSPSWLRRQPGLLRYGEPGQPLYHARACRAYYLGRLAGLDPNALRTLQLRAVAAACGFEEDDALPELPGLNLAPPANAADSTAGTGGEPLVVPTDGPHDS